jgi:hypothetical protein
LPLEGIGGLTVLNRWTRRLGRSGIHCFEKTGNDSAVVVANQSIFSMDEGNGRLVRKAKLTGSRPLSMCVSGGTVYYGEYRRNSDRSPVHVWAGNREGDAWTPAWRFDGIRHVHGVFSDPFTGHIWVTTGDEDDESGIWRTDDGFKSLCKVAGGSQQYRAVTLLFSEDLIYFGSDSPDLKNYIYVMDRETGEIDARCRVSEPVFYGTKVGDQLFLSTAIEPSEVNDGREAIVWGSSNGYDWRVILRFAKDRLPMKLFQYGQVQFPAGPGDGDNLWCTPFATTMDQKTIKIKINSSLERSE